MAAISGSQIYMKNSEYKCVSTSCKKITICLMFDAGGWGPGLPRVSTPIATLRRISLCNCTMYACSWAVGRRDRALSAWEHRAPNDQS